MQTSEVCVQSCSDIPVRFPYMSGTTVMWMAALPPVGTTPGAASQVSALAFINDFQGIVNVCTSNFRQGQSVYRELIEVSCEVSGTPQSDQNPSSAQRSCAWRRLRFSWYLLLALAALASVVVGVVL
jgi:hypothetical protein